MGYSCCYCSTTTAAVFPPQLPPVLLFTPLANRQPHRKVSDPLRCPRPHPHNTPTPSPSRYRPRPSRLVAAPRNPPPKNRRAPRAPASLTAAARVGWAAGGTRALARSVLASADPYSVHTPAAARCLPYGSRGQSASGRGHEGRPHGRPAGSPRARGQNWLGD
jgi:hypothetical protein